MFIAAVYRANEIAICGVNLGVACLPTASTPPIGSGIIGCATALAKGNLELPAARTAVNTSAGSFRPRFNHFLIGICLLPLLGVSGSALAGLRWSARAIDPSLIDAMRNDDKLLEAALFGEQPKVLTETLKKEGHVDLSDKQIRDELTAWAAKRNADVGDTGVDLDKAWHGIHYLLTGSAGPNGTLLSKVIFGSEDIGPNRGYGPAQLVKPDEVKAIAQLLAETTPDMLRKRFKPEEMTRADVYPSVIWERDGDEALSYVLENYKKLIAFYKLAAERGQAVIFVIS